MFELLGQDATICLGFPAGSATKESTCNTGDLGLIPGLEDPLETGKASHSNILAYYYLWPK